MIKKINVKPVDYLEFNFPDGSVRRAKFTTYAFATLQEEFGGVQKIFKGAKDKPFEATATLLYAGMKACDPSIEHLQVQALVSDFDAEVLKEVLEFLQIALPTSMSTELTPETAPEGMNRKNRRASQRTST